jgi:uncharacterized delta-60 repeat protein
LAAAFSIAALAWASPSPRLDPHFHPSFTTTAGAELRAVAVQADGKAIVAGRFEFFHGRPISGLVRLDTDGGVDTRFALWPGVEGAVNSVAIQQDGKIVFGGDFTSVAGQARHGAARVGPEGTLDEAFAPRVDGQRSRTIEVVRVLEDGRLFIGGQFRTVESAPRACVARLKPDGTLDETFDPGAGVEDAFGIVQDLAPLPDGGVVVAGLFTKFDGQTRPGLVRLDAEGNVVPEFNPDLDWSQGLVSVALVRRQEDGYLLVAGRFDQLEGQALFGLARLQQTGVADPSFEGDSWRDVVVDAVRDLAIQPDGRIVVTGDFDRFAESLHPGIARLEASGAPDETFDPGPGLRTAGRSAGVGMAVAVQADGRILVAGQFSQIGTEVRHNLGRLHADGSADPDYSDSNRIVERVGSVNAITVQEDGRILVGGDFERVDGQPRQALARVLPHGALDESFDAHVSKGGVVNAIVLQPRGEVIVGGRFATVQAKSRASLVRLAANSQLDTTFDPGLGPNGEVYCLALQPDSHILVGGLFDQVNGVPRFRLARLDASGAVDPEFDPYVASWIAAPDVYSIVAQDDQRLVIGGYFDTVNGQTRSGLARLRPDGSLDSDFGGASLLDGDLPIVTGIALDGDGRLLVIGTFSTVESEPRHGIARLDSEGTLDRSFDPGAGIAGGDLPAVYGAALGPGGWWVIVGEFESFNGTTRLNLAVVRADGSLDPDFAPKGWMDRGALAAAVDADGNILVGGPFTTIDGKARQGLARFRSADPAPASVTIELDQATAVVSWKGPGTLQSSDSPIGPWRDEPGLDSPATVSPSQPARFFRVVR